MSNALASNTSVPQRARSSMPDHMRLNKWPFPYPLSALLQCIFTGCCVLAYGHTTLDEVWHIACEDRELWEKRKKLMATRLNQTNVTGGLLLATLAGWLTTNPSASTIFDYTARGPYICLLASFGLILGSVIVGSAVLYSMPMVTAKWQLETAMGSRLSVCGTLILVTYPFFAMAAGTTVSVIGFLLAGFNSQVRLVQASCIFVVLIPASLALVLIYNQIRSMLVQKPKGQVDDYPEGLPVVNVPRLC